MDPITHFLTGGCLGRAGFNRKSALATVTMVIAAEAADIDIVWGFKGSIADLQHHRGITHSFVGVPFIAAGALALVYLIYRTWSRYRPPLKLPVRWGYLYFLAVLAALSHLLLDYSTAYGIRLFEPFNYRWYTWDLVFIIDPVIWLLLIAGLCVPALFGLINQEIGARRTGPRGRTGAIIALAGYALLLGGRDIQHRRALDTMDSFLYHGEAPRRVAAYPYMINPFRWHGVVETADFFETVPVDSLTPDVKSESQGRMFYKPEETDASRAAKASYLGRVYLDWAVFPYVRTQPFTGGYFAQFQDLRYTYPDWPGRIPLAAYVVLGPDLRVLEEGMISSKSPTLESLENGSGAQ